MIPGALRSHTTMFRVLRTAMRVSLVVMNVLIVLDFASVSGKLMGIYSFLKYYDPEIIATLDALRATHDLPTLGQLVEQDVISVTTGDEIGKLSYGTGSIPFIRTSDISNWELKIDPKHGVSQEDLRSIPKAAGCQVR